MDKYIRMLLIKLAPKYKITITMIMFYDDEKQGFSNIIKLKVRGRFSEEVKNIDCNGKRMLISELMKWLSD